MKKKINPWLITDYTYGEGYFLLNVFKNNKKKLA